jgi:hypothetical protein
MQQQQRQQQAETLVCAAAAWITFKQSHEDRVTAAR